MANLAQQIKEELTQKARENEICKTRLLDWVMSQFRAGQNPVRIECGSYSKRVARWMDCTKLKAQGVQVEYTASLKRDGDRIIAHAFVEDIVSFSGMSKHFENGEINIDITDTDFACSIAIDGVDEQNKRLYLESEGFKVVKRETHEGPDLLLIYY